MKISLLIFAFLVALGISAFAVQPNVLIVLVDDAGYGDFSCHGNPVLKTPEIDKLYGESVRFTNFHVSPMCTPTRGELLTGVNALRNAAASVTAGRALLRPGIPTLPEMLATGGYRTGIFGKWHLGDNYPNRPMDKGFQDAVWVKGWGFTSAPEFTNTLFDGRCYRGDKEARFSGYITDFCFHEAMQWMRARHEKEEPFFCYLPLHAAHAPHVVGDSYAEPYANYKEAGKFFGMLANVDENMGRLDSFLRETGLRENTILVFLTDNGGTSGVQIYNAGLRGHKTEYYDGGHRVPCFVRWPEGKLRAAGDVATPAEAEDLAPTLLELCGVSPSKSAHFDGLSLAPVLRGSGEIPERTLVVQIGASPAVTTDPKKWRSCVIWNEWRLVHGDELYEMNTDRAQQKNLADSQPEVFARLRAYYEKWWAGVEPGLKDFVPISLGAPQEPVTQLTSSDWQDVYADNAGHVRAGAGGPRGGPWNVLVERSGDYEITLRRWPVDLDLALDATDGDPKAKAFPIAAARLRVAGRELTAKTPAGARTAAFRTALPAGRTQLQGWFQDAGGVDLCGAFYATVTLVK